MEKNPLAHLQRKKNPQSFHEKFIQLPYLEVEEEVSESIDTGALEKVASRKPVMIDKTNLPFDRKRVLEHLARRGALTVRPSLREVPREPFPVGAMDDLPEKEGVIEEIDKEIPDVLDIEPIAPSAEELPVPVKKLRGKMVKKVVTEKETDKAEQKMAKVGEKPVAKRMEKWISEKESRPVAAPVAQPVVHKVSAYYLNNRKKFLTEINHLFSKYRATLADKEKDISCQTQKEKGAFELMTHQKVITDYLNLYSPYRGLLLYHGLGTGKCHKKDTPLLMYDGVVKMVQDVRVGDLLMGDDSTPRTVLSLANGRDAMYDVISFKGEKYTVNREHILCLKDREGKVVEMTVEEFLQLTDEEKQSYKGYRVAVEFMDKEISVHPYVVGKNLINNEKEDIPI